MRKNVSKSKLFDIQQNLQKEKVKEKEKTPGKVFRGFRGLCAAFVVAVAVVVT